MTSFAAAVRAFFALAPLLVPSSVIANMLLLGVGPGPGDVYNFNPTVNLTHWRAAKAAVHAGTGRGMIAFVGDSTTFGWGAGTGGSPFVGAHDLSGVMRSAHYMQVGGLPTTIDSQIGGVSPGGIDTPAKMTAYNPRFSVTGSGWGMNPNLAAVNTIGGTYTANTTTTADLLTATPTAQVDTFKFWAYQDPSQGSYSWNIDGGSDTTINQAAGPSALVVQTISTTKGTHALNVKRVSGISWNIGWIAYDSTTPAIDVVNMGWPASRSTSWVPNTAFDPIHAIPLLGASLLVINLGINDWENGVPPATTAANIQLLITAQKNAGGDVIISMPTPTAGSASPATQATYLPFLIALANTNNIPLINWTARYTSWAVQNARGWTFDSLHPNALLYDDEGQFLAQLLLGA
jgi:GDSL-like Lipase/Acylhydrolase family